MDTLPGTQFTDMWLANPWGTQPDQLSNKFSNFNNAPFPYPPTYNEGLAGGPVDAATGQPLQSYLDWKAANPAGVTLNNTPAQPNPNAQAYVRQNALLNQQAANLQNANTGANYGPELQNLQLQNLANAQAYGGPYYDASRLNAIQANPNATLQQIGQATQTPQYMQGNLPIQMPGGGTFGGPTPYQQAMNAQQAQPQPSGPPNNWQAALNSLARPPAVQTQGATVPQSNTFQPAAGVNQAFLQNAAARGGGNPGFLGALSAIQNRPNQQW